MATSNYNRASGCEANPFFEKLFRESQSASMDDRELEWKRAMANAGSGREPMRFPIYEALYLINLYSQKLVDILADSSRIFGVAHNEVVIYQSMVQSARAGASQRIVELMDGVEQTEEWLFERLLRNEEFELREPEDAYIDVRKQEAKRLADGLPPRIKFLEENRIDDEES